MAAPVVTTALHARGVTKDFGEGPTAVHALRGVDLEVQTGDFVAIMGPSGSGKSLLHILGALDRPSAATLEIRGRRYDQMPDRELTELRGETFASSSSSSTCCRR